MGDISNTVSVNAVGAGRATEATGLSWLWAFLFGPLYFAVWGFWGRAVILLILNFLIIGFFIAPFMAYPAWRARAAGL